MAGAITLALMAQTPTKPSPRDEMFIDMAVTAAYKSVNSGGTAAGAVIVSGGAWKATGTASADGKTAEENAIAKMRIADPSKAAVYTVNEPTTRAYNAIAAAGIGQIYYVNTRDAAVNAGVAKASDYDDSAKDTDHKVTVTRLTYAEAQKVLSSKH